MTRMLWDKPGTIEERFDAFVAAHPELLEEFCRIALQLRRAGRKHYSADAILRHIRTSCDIDGRDVEPFRCNNNYTPLLARRAMERHPELKGFFETRTRKGTQE